MPVYRLTPIEPSLPIWGATTVCGVFLVRAGDESQARRMVAEYCAFGDGTSPRTDSSTAPWRDAATVLVERVEAPVELEVGDEAVLSFASMSKRGEGGS